MLLVAAVLQPNLVGAGGQGAGQVVEDGASGVALKLRLVAGEGQVDVCSRQRLAVVVDGQVHAYLLSGPPPVGQPEPQARPNRRDHDHRSLRGAGQQLLRGIPGEDDADVMGPRGQVPCQVDGGVAARAGRYRGYFGTVELPSERSAGDRATGGTEMGYYVEPGGGRSRRRASELDPGRLGRR